MHRCTRSRRSRRSQPTVGSSRRRGGGVEGIFGRDLELAVIERFLDSGSTWPSAVVIEGEAGIGKTTLWLEGLRRAEERGIRTLHAQPAESEQKLSYVALTDLVVEAFDEVGSVLPRVRRRARSVCREGCSAARRRRRPVARFGVGADAGLCAAPLAAQSWCAALTPGGGWTRAAARARSSAARGPPVAHR